MQHDDTIIAASSNLLRDKAKAAMLRGDLAASVACIMAAGFVDAALRELAAAEIQRTEGDS